MDTYRHDSAHITCAPRIAAFAASSPEEKATHRRWARAVLAFYCALSALVGIAILTSHTVADPNDQLAQASLQKNSPARAGQ